ncbi:MAG: hypothetical protein AB1522_04445 [Chloroflexota bacterium]
MRTSHITSFIITLLVMSVASCSGFDSTPAIDTQVTIATKERIILVQPTSKSTIPAFFQTKLPPPEQNDKSPFPTLSAEEAKILLLELVHNPKDCPLPCLWNLQPGQTTAKVAYDFVSQFGYIKTDELEIVSEYFGNSGGVGISHKMDDIHIVTDFSYYYSQSGEVVNLLHLYSYTLKDYGADPITGLPQLAPIWATEQFNQEMQSYLLSTILKLYGLPDEVLVGTWLEEADYYGSVTYRPFSLLLLYLQHGFIIEYQSIRGSIGEDYTGCPYESHIKITTWSPKDNVSMQEITEKASFTISIESLRPIDEVTDLTVESFYLKFRDEKTRLCIHTPAKLWQALP